MTTRALCGLWSVQFFAGKLAAEKSRNPQTQCAAAAQDAKDSAGRVFLPFLSYKRGLAEGPFLHSEVCPVKSKWL